MAEASQEVEAVVGQEEGGMIKDSIILTKRHIEATCSAITVRSSGILKRTVGSGIEMQIST